MQFDGSSSFPQGSVRPFATRNVPTHPGRVHTPPLDGGAQLACRGNGAIQPYDWLNLHAPALCKSICRHSQPNGRRGLWTSLGGGISCIGAHAWRTMSSQEPARDRNERMSVGSACLHWHVAVWLSVACLMQSTCTPQHVKVPDHLELSSHIDAPLPSACNTKPKSLPTKHTSSCGCKVRSIRTLQPPGWWFGCSMRAPEVVRLCLV